LSFPNCKFFANLFKLIFIDKDEKLTSTLRYTLELYKKNKCLEEIAKIRGLTSEQIERHIIILITKSFIDVNDFVEKSKIEKILNNLNNENIVSLKKIKESLSEDITYFEIKCVLADLNRRPITKNK